MLFSNGKYKMINFDDVTLTCLLIKSSPVFIMQTYFAVPNDSRLNSSYYFIMKIPNKIEL